MGGNDTSNLVESDDVTREVDPKSKNRVELPHSDIRSDISSKNIFRSKSKSKYKNYSCLHYYHIHSIIIA